MKTIKHALPPNLSILDIANWCEDNRIPMLFGSMGLDWWSRRGILNDEMLYTDMTMHDDYLIVRECDYALVKLRF